MDKSRVKYDFMDMTLANFIALCMYVSLTLFANVLFVLPPMAKVEYDELIHDFQTQND